MALSEVKTGLAGTEDMLRIFVTDRRKMLALPPGGIQSINTSTYETQIEAAKGGGKIVTALDLFRRDLLNVLGGAEAAHPRKGKLFFNLTAAEFEAFYPVVRQVAPNVLIGMDIGKYFPCQQKEVKDAHPNVHFVALDAHIPFHFDWGNSGSVSKATPLAGSAAAK
ncbi:hypothetical protein IPG41_03475 [Candidatus Peregrinibacteria bacterium]|nr:MAG: hypothetical protein IPG41_03475 [Candidatus Peregrinibacteria bacterium]